MAQIEKYDVVVIGAGISGVNAGYRIQSALPNYTYTILEARANMGGTWDLFKYPGIRSDSDLHTFGFPWRPWRKPNSIADGQSIVEYIKETAAIHGIDKHIQFNHSMKSANWSSEQQTWRIDCETNGQQKQVYGRFTLFATGYYDYHAPLATTIPGIDNFKGVTVHPQFWPEDLDYAGKKMAVIGSGATAVTLLPNLAEKADHVTMVQRSPGYLISLPQVDKLDILCRKILPDWLAHRITRWKFLVLPYIFFLFCRRYPERAKKVLQKNTTKQLPASIPHNPHFEPAYNPWEQRMCVCPDGDFYKSLREGRTSVATGQIKTFKDKSIVLESGQEIEADVVVTATGLKLQFAGGADVYVDGEKLNVRDKFLWKGVMLQDLPNAAFVIGYTNASWTLGADATAQLFTRLIKDMDSQHATSAVPKVQPGQELHETSPLNLNSTYVQKGLSAMPKSASEAPWQPRSNYFSDIWTATFGDIKTGLQFYHVSS